MNLLLQSLLFSRSSYAIVLLTLACLNPGSSSSAHVHQDAFAVVVHESNPLATMPREQVARMFLRKVGRWSSGAPVMPVDLPVASPVREAFSEQVLGRSVAAVRAFWNARIFSGRDTPPPEKVSETEVLAFVRSTPNAIGYVSVDTPLPRGVRAIGIDGP